MRAPPLTQVPKGLSSLAADGMSLESQFEWAQFKGEIVTEAPNDKVNDFTGQIKLCVAAGRWAWGGTAASCVQGMRETKRTLTGPCFWIHAVLVAALTTYCFCPRLPVAGMARLPRWSMRRMCSCAVRHTLGALASAFSAVSLSLYPAALACTLSSVTHTHTHIHRLHASEHRVGPWPRDQYGSGMQDQFHWRAQGISTVVDSNLWSQGTVALRVPRFFPSNASIWRIAGRPRLVPVRGSPSGTKCTPSPRWAS